MISRPPLRPRVDFVIGGVQKGGTTFVYDALAKRPEFDLPERKEQRFFIDERYFRRHPSPRNVIRDYNKRFPQTRLLTGDATPAYLWWPRAVRRIQAVAPEVRWIVLLRNPISRAYSQWRMRREAGRESKSFDEVIAEQLELQHGEPRYPDPERFEHPGYLTRGLYAPQLRLLFEAFDPGRVAIVSTAALRAKSDERVADLAQFLQGRAGIIRRIEVGPGRELPEDFPAETWNALAAFFQPSIEGTGKLLGADLSAWSTAHMSD